MNRKSFFSFLLLVALLFSFTAFSESSPLKSYKNNENAYQYVSFGIYPQAPHSPATPLLWRVLQVEEGKALLLSEFILGNGSIHSDAKEYEGFHGEWKKTDLYHFLNHDFLHSAFIDKERRILHLEEELGKIFLLSSEDLKNPDYGFTSDKDRQGYGSEYAGENGLFVYSKGSSPYWTRTQSTTQLSGTRCTKSKGNIGYIRCIVENLGWRPAVWIDLAKIDIQLGNGSLEEPFVLIP